MAVRDRELRTWDALLHRPQRLLLRRVLFQIHLWLGLGVGLYLLIIGVSGSLLVFREEIESNLYPQLFKISNNDQPQVEMSGIIRTVDAKYPDHELLGIYAPVGYRQTFVAWLSKNDDVFPVFVDPITGDILGTRPTGSWISRLQDLHFYLFSGRAGLFINGVGGLLLFALCMTGAAIWWPGVEQWRRNTWVNFRNNWKRVIWDVHSAVGFWTVAILVMFALTGVYFAFPQPFKSIVNRISPITAIQTPSSNPSQKGQQLIPEFAAMIRTARQSMPEAELARISMSSTATAPFQVVLAPNGMRDFNEVGYVSFYFDQYTGRLLERRSHVNGSAGDVTMAWVAALHVGNFGGLFVKILWAMLGLAPAALFLTGALMWWYRIGNR